MMNITRTGQIEMTRGDDISFCLYIASGDNLDSLRYELTNCDELYFGIMEPNKPFECSVVKKAYKNVVDNEINFLPIELDEEGNIVIRIDSKDTINLLEGVYYYEIKLNRKKYKDESLISEEIHTLVPKTKFIIL